MPPRQPVPTEPVLLSTVPTRAVDIAERVVWTFIQGFFGAVPFTVALDSHHLEAVGLAGAAGGVAAVISLAKNLTKTTHS